MMSAQFVRHVVTCSAKCFSFMPRKSPLAVSVANYKSQYNIEHLYPNSRREFNSKLADQMINNQSKSPDEFTGLIPLDKINMSYMKASGPGGQNVNKVNSKVEVRFHLESADWIPDWIKERLIITERGRINRDGVLIVTSEKTRKQMLNQADCLEKIRTMIYTNSKVANEPTIEEVKLKESRMAKAKRGILLEKRQHSLKKQTRQSPSMGSA